MGSSMPTALALLDSPGCSPFRSQCDSGSEMDRDELAPALTLHAFLERKDWASMDEELMTAVMIMFQDNKIAVRWLGRWVRIHTYRCLSHVCARPLHTKSL